jgi:hypothetical protein
MAGYGLRRMLVSASGVRKQELAFGERKSIATDRVILVPGPASEVQCVRDIFRMLITEKLRVRTIAGCLNQSGIEYTQGRNWDYKAVYSILTHPKYMGCNVYGRTSSRLYTPMLKSPPSEWVVAPGAIEPLIDPDSFAEAQRLLRARTVNRTDQELLEALRVLLGSKRRLTTAIIEASPDVASASTYRHRFGSLEHAYELIGYEPFNQFIPTALRRQTQALQEQLVNRIAGMFPERVTINNRGGRWRNRLQMRNGILVSVLIGRSIRENHPPRRWIVLPAPTERRLVTVLARLTNDNFSFEDFYVLPNISHKGRFVIRYADPWLARGEKLCDLQDFCISVARVRSAKNKTRPAL